MSNTNNKPPQSPPVVANAAAATQNQNQNQNQGTPTRGGTQQTTIAPTSNVTQKLGEAQRRLLDYDQESRKLTQEKYMEYLAMRNSTNISGDPNMKNADGKTVEDLKKEWEDATNERTSGRQAIEKEIQEILNPALAENDEDRKTRLAAIQEQSEKACLEKTPTNIKRFRKPELEKAIDQLGGAGTQPFKESAKF